LMMNNRNWLRVGNLMFLIATLALNGLSGGVLRPGYNIGSLSDKYFTLFAPAGLTFSIWGLIYLSLIGFSIFQLRGLFNKGIPQPAYLSQIGPWFMLSCVFNMTWLLAWLYEYIGLSLLLMLGLLGSLLMIYLRLGIGQAQATNTVRFAVHLPFSIYLSWISVATIANVSAWLVSMNLRLGGLSAEYWTVTMVGIAGILGAFVANRRKDWAYAGVLLWALLGIILKHQGLGEMGFQSIQVAAGVSMGMVLLGRVLAYWSN
ncbi:MAG: hypothetical protein AAF804_01045, partial [Bacteroidota bacterium]